MALITSFEPSQKERNTIHRSTKCFYSIVRSNNGQSYLQLDTVGSEDRQLTDKISQSIQFDKKAAEHLIQLLGQTFPELKG